MHRFHHVLAALAFALPLSAAAAATELPCAVPCSLASRGVTRMLTPVVEEALAVVVDGAPTALPHVFGWSGDGARLSGKTVTVLVTTTADPLLTDMRTGPGGIALDMDAATIALVQASSGRSEIFVLLLADRLFFDEGGSPRHDAFARTVLALGHELYGNVQFHLEQDARALPPMSLELRRTMEIRAFEASLSFFRTLRAAARWTAMTPALRNELEALVPAEHARLLAWQAR